MGTQKGRMQSPAMSAAISTAVWKSSVQCRSIAAFPEVPTQWTSGLREIPSGVGLAGVVRVKPFDAPDESHSIGSSGAPLAPVTWTTAAAPPRPGSEPIGAVNVLGAEWPWKGTGFAHPVHPSKLKVMLPSTA